nr:leucine-rich repeat-containing protein [Tanacetum cinerariifolium]
LLQDDFSLNDGTGITIISDSHKGLLDGVHDWLPQAEHKNALGISMPISRRSLVEFNCRGSFAFSLEDTITPSIRKRLEVLKEKQRHWIVFPNGFQELEVRNGDDSFGVNLQHK